jgi:hypothetical protein
MTTEICNTTVTSKEPLVDLLRVALQTACSLAENPGRVQGKCVRIDLTVEEVATDA